MSKLAQRNRRSFLSACGTLAGAALLQQASPAPLLAKPAPSSQHADRVRFGRTDLFVSRYCQGTAFRNLRRAADDEQGQLVYRRCLELGVNFFDSSNVYGWGGAEEALGKAIAGRRKELVVCTKVYPGLKPEGAFTRQTPVKKVPLTREFAFRAVEGSLKRLRTDYIDLYLLHIPDEFTPPQEILDTMDALVRSGKIRYWGVSNHSAAQVGEFMKLSEKQGKARIAGTEDHYSIVERDLEEVFFPVLRQEDLGLMAYSPLGAGKLVPGREAEADAPLAKLLAEMDRWARELDVGRPQIAIAWVLAHQEVTSVLGGAERPEHVEENVAGSKLVLPAEALAALNAASDTYRRQTKKEHKTV